VEEVKKIAGGMRSIEFESLAPKPRGSSCPTKLGHPWPERKTYQRSKFLYT